MWVALTVGESSIAKKLIRLDWEKAVYRLLFMLANTLQSHGKNVLIKNMVHTYDFQENNKNVIILENMQEIIAL